MSNNVNWLTTLLEDSSYLDDFAVITRPRAIPKDCEDSFYFEVTVLDAGLQNMVALGIHPAGTIAGMVGWQENSYAYHGDDGIMRTASKNTNAKDRRKIEKGDVLGCGIKSNESLVYFTKNGVIIGALNIKPVVPFFPVISGSDMAVISINMGSSPFCFTSVASVSRSMLEADQLLAPTASAPRVRKGVGYAEHRSAAVWNIDQHAVKMADERKRVKSLFEILSAFFKTNSTVDQVVIQSAECIEVLKSSCLLEALQQQLNNDSFTDMCKNPDLYLHVLELIRNICSWTHLSFLITSLRPQIAK